MADNNFMGSTMAVAVTATILSPRVRGMLRTGAVQGLAGVLIAGDAISSFARGLGRGLQAENAGAQPHVSATEAAQEAARAAQEAATAARTAAEAAQNAARPQASARTRKAATQPNTPMEAGGGEP
jgi:hypothetical protein